MKPWMIVSLAMMWLAAGPAGGATVPPGFEVVWPPQPLSDLSSFAVAEDGTVVAGGTGPVLLVSGDHGASWERVALPEGVEGVRSLAWGAGRFLAVTLSGDVVVSTGGADWTLYREDPPLDWVEDLAWAGDAFVAVGGACVDAPASCGKADWAVAARSIDGREWEEILRRELSYGAWPREVAGSGDVLVAAPLADNDPYTFGVLVSRDRGRSWEAVRLDFAPDHVTTTDTGFYVLGRAFVRSDGVLERPAGRSGDGMTWTALDAASLGPAEIEGVAWTGGRLVAVSEEGTADSRDGEAWSWLDGPSTAVHPGFAGLGVVAGVGLWGVGREETVLALAGSHWQVLTTRGMPDLARLAASPRRLVAVGSAWLPGMSPLMGSADGLTWEVLPVPEGIGEVTDVVWTGERFLAAAGAWTLASEDGISWEQHAPGSAAVHGFEVVPGGVLAVGDDAGFSRSQAGGVVLWSSDGIDWEVRARVGAGLEDVACTGDGSLCVAVGWAGLVAAGAPDGVWTETYLAPEDPSAALAAVATNGRRWVVAGSAGMFTSGAGLAWEAARYLSPSFAWEAGGRDVAWVGDGFLAVDDAPSGPSVPSADIRIRRSLDGRWWGTAAEGPGTLSHVAAAGGRAWLLGRGGSIARARPAPSAAEAAPHAYLLPAAAHTAGLAGTLWQSDLFLAPEDAEGPVTADLFLLTSGAASAEASRRRIAMGASETVPAEDLVAEGFHADGVTGAVLVHADGPLAGWSRTFTERSEGGSYGQMIPLVPLQSLAPVQDLIGLEEDGSFRTNLGLVNAGPEAITARVEVHGTLGELLGVRELELEPFSLVFRTRFLRELGVAPVENVWIRVLFPFSQEHPHPPCLAFASVVDQGTGDPSLVLPQPAMDGDQMVPVVVHLPGYNETLWRTDLHVANTGSREALLELEYWPADALAPPASSPQLALAPGAAVVYRDVVASVLGTSDKGALVVHTLEGAVAVRSRTYTVAGGGSFGQAIPAVSPAVSSLQWGRWIGLPLEDGGEPPFRVNIGVVNSSDESRELGFWGPDNPDLENWLLPPHTLHQLDHALRPGSSGWAPWVRVTFSSWDGPVMGYASIVDNRTGDPTFLPAQPR